MGKLLKGQEIIELYGDLGSGKTTFVKGLAIGLGYNGLVSSPTFSLVKVYQTANLSLYHFDLYRLDSVDWLEKEIAEVHSQTKAILAIEWPQLVDNFLTSDKIIIDFKTISNYERSLIFKYPPSFKEIFSQL